MRSNGKKRPDVRIFLNADGTPRSQCVDSNGNGKLDARYRLSGGQINEGVLDTKGDGKGDLRQKFEGGVVTRVEVDTNNDGRPDVIQYLQGEAIVRQCEDSEFDGTIDRCFEGESAVAVSGVTDVSQPIGDLGCGGFHSFWRR
jgi:hypothetical protein